MSINNGKGAVSALRQRVTGAAPEPGSIIQLRKTVLAGGFCAIPSNLLWRSPQWKLVVYLSSSHSDCKIERDLLINNLLPHIRKNGIENGISVEIVDLKWGIRSETECIEETWEYRKREIKRCREESVGLFFITLQSNRYGAAPLPSSIPRAQLDKLLSSRPEADKALVLEWYAIDRNAIPEMYVLSNKVDYSYFDTSVAKLLKILDTIHVDEDFCEDLLIGRSLQEWEVKAAFAHEHNRARLYWLHRSWEDPGTSHKDKTDFFDTKESLVLSDRLESLHTWMGRRFEATTVSHFKPIAFSSFEEKDSNWLTYLEEFRHDTAELLHKSLSSIIKSKREWMENGHGLGIGGEELTEMFLHSSLSFSHCHSFVGRTDLLASASEIIFATGESEQKTTLHNFGVEALPLENVTLVLVGGAGTGKSYLMARLADEVYKREMKTKLVIIRHCGASPTSSTGFGMIHSICAQIHFLLGQKFDHASIAASYEDTVAHFQSLMASYAIILFLDGLDRLQDENFSRTQISFLKGVTLHAESRIILSTRPDHHDALSNRWVTYYGCDSRLREDGVTRLYVRRFNVTSFPMSDPGIAEEEEEEHVVIATANDGEDFDFHIDLGSIASPLPSPQRIRDREDAAAMVVSILAQARRTVTEVQLNAILEAVAKDSRIVTIDLLCKMSESLPSFALRPSLPQTGTSGIIRSFIDVLSQRYHEVIIKHVIGFISFSVRGVSDSELLDLLSLCDEVLDEVYTFSSPVEGRFSAHIWYYIKGDLRHFLTVLEDGCLTWKNDVIGDCIKDLFTSEETHELHAKMAVYFGNLVQPTELAERKIFQQPVVLNGHISSSVWFRDVSINKRRCTEAVHHMLSANMLQQAVVELCDIESICARVKCGLGYFLVSQLIRLATLVQNQRVDHYLHWLSHHICKIMIDPALYIVQTCSQQPIVSTARRDMNLLMYSYTEYCNFGDEVWKRCICLGGKQDFGALINTVEGHHNRVTCVSWSPDGSKLLSASWDKSICIWDPKIGLLTCTCEGHGAAVTCVSWCPDSLLFASSSWDNTVAVWDSVAGQVVQLLEGHSDFVCSVAWSPDKRYIASGSYDNTAIIWSAISGTAVHVLEGHSKWVVSVAWSPDSSLLATGSYDRNVMVWIVDNGAFKLTYCVHTAAVVSLAWCNSGKFLASASIDKNICVWDSLTEKVTTTINCVDNAVNCISWSDDDSKLAIAAADKVVRIWSFHTKSVVAMLEGHTDVITSVCWSHNSSVLASASADFSIKLWDSLILQREVVNETHSKAILSMMWSPDSRSIATAGSDNLVIIWDAQTSKITATLRGHTKDVVCLCWSPDSRFTMSGSLDSSVITWDVAGGLAFRTDLIEDGYHANAVAWSRQISMAAQGTSTGTIRVIDSSSGRVLRTLGGHQASVTSLDFSPASFTTLVSGSCDNLIHLWDCVNGMIICQLSGHRNWVTCVRWHKDGLLLASGSLDKTIRLWNTVSKKQLEDYYIHSHSINNLSWHTDGQRIAFCGTDKAVFTWDSSLVSGEAYELNGHEGEVTAVCWSPSGNKLGSSSTDRSVRIWDAVRNAVKVSREGELKHAT